MRYLNIIFAVLGSLSILTGCGKKIEVEHLNNYTSLIKVVPAVDRLWIPVEEGAAEAALIARTANGNAVPVYVSMAQNRVDYHVPFDMKGVEQLRVENCSYENVCWDELTILSPAELDDRYRQQVHFSSPRGWINDPNGMVCHNGEWHLFFQHNPYGAKWGNMSWGHAVSRDLVGWETLETVLFPDELGAIFSGSAVIDADNTAGFGAGAMIAIYTSAGARQAQSIAYSRDNGRSFVKYENNPVLSSPRADFRDPKLFWHKLTERWIMIVAAGNAMEIYSSQNLREWTFESRWGERYGYHSGVWECPDLFELPYGDGSKWVLLCSLNLAGAQGSAVQYFVGRFDGHTFVCDTPESYTDLLNYGRDNYAAVSWNNAPEGRKVLLGWQNNWVYANDLPTNGYRGYMTFPQELKLVEWNGKAKLVAAPVAELDDCLQEVFSAGSIVVDGEYAVWQRNCGDDALVVECSMADIGSQIVGLKLSNDCGEWVDIAFDTDERQFKVDRLKSGKVDFNASFASVAVAPMSAERCQRLRIIIDRSSIECFTDIAATSDLVFPQSRFTRLSLYTIGGSTEVKNLKISKINK